MFLATHCDSSQLGEFVYHCIPRTRGWEHDGEDPCRRPFDVASREISHSGQNFFPCCAVQLLRLLLFLQPEQRMAYRLSAVLVLMAIGGWLAGRAAAQQPAGPPAVGVVRTERQQITQTDEFIGRIQAVNRVALVARVTGFLEKRMFVEGSEVKQGDLLYLLEQPPFQAQVDARSNRGRNSRRSTSMLSRRSTAPRNCWGAVRAPDQCRLPRWRRSERWRRRSSALARN